MNKRGQMYVLAAVLLCFAIYGVMKVTNRLELPPDTNFDFYVENFRGEKAYVVDLGVLGVSTDFSGSGGLLDIFTKFGSGTGIILVEYEDEKGWTVTNFLGKDVIMVSENDKETAIPSGNYRAGAITFELGKDFIVVDSSLSEVDGESFKRTSTANEISLEFYGNVYGFKKPSTGNSIESIIFQNVDDNYVKVVKV